MLSPLPGTLFSQWPSCHSGLSSNVTSSVKPLPSLLPLECQGETSTPVTGSHNGLLHLLRALWLLGTGRDCACLVNSYVPSLPGRGQINTRSLFVEKYLLSTFSVIENGI